MTTMVLEPFWLRPTALAIGIPLAIGGLLAVVLAARMRRQARALHESDERYRLLVENSPVAIVVSIEGEMVYANSAAARLVGAGSAGDIVGRTVDDFLDPRDRRKVRARVQSVGANGHATALVETRIRRLDGERIDVAALTIPGMYGGRAASQVVITDITARKRTEEQLVHDAMHDPLTGLPNRALFADRLERLVKQRARNPDRRFAVLFLDLDRFKLINDSLGHLQGDRLLCVVAKRLRRCLRASDTVARLGGDEFAILVNDVQDATCATRIAERLQEELRSSIRLEGHDVVIGASIGIAVSSVVPESPEDLLRNADTAMYRAKERTAGSYQLFDRDMHADAMDRLRLETDLREAVEREELRLVYQPIYSLEDGTVEGVEALLRWDHPERGLLKPPEFLRVAEETGIIVPIGWWVIEEACAQLSRWDRNHGRRTPPKLNINISERQLRQGDLTSRLAAVLEKTGLDPERLILEITESVIMADAEETITMLRELKQLGVRICIDDFGTGYSSLSYLHRFSVDALKVDRSFVSGGGEHASVNWQIVHVIVLLARELGIGLVAEGVETPEQLGMLRDAGAPAAQGNLFCLPLEPERVPGVLAAHAVGENLLERGRRGAGAQPA